MRETALSDVELQRYTPANTDWRELVAKVDNLPSLPSVAAEALGLLDNPKSTVQQLAKVIERDVGLSTRVLRLANSALFARANKIATIPDATKTLGFQTLRGLMLAASIGGLRKNQNPTWDILWKHSVGVALVARSLARELKRSDVDEVFTCGLLHNLGQVLLESSRPGSYREVFEEIELGSCNYQQAEEKVFQVAHPVVGALLMRKWNLPSHTSRVAMCYLEPLKESLFDESIKNTKIEAQALLIRCADLVCHQAKIGSPNGYPVVQEELQDYLSHLSPNSQKQNLDLEEFCVRARELFEREFALYH